MTIELATVAKPSACLCYSCQAPASGKAPHSRLQELTGGMTTAAPIQVSNTKALPILDQQSRSGPSAVSMTWHTGACSVRHRI